MRKTATIDGWRLAVSKGAAAIVEVPLAVTTQAATHWSHWLAARAGRYGVARTGTKRGALLH